MPSRFTWMITTLCGLALAATVLAFVNGSWIMGVLWLLITGFTSNLAWFQFRRARRAHGHTPAAGRS